MHVLRTVSVVALLELSAGAQTLMRSVPGPAAGVEFGRSCIVVPDQNGDAVKDVLVGAPGFNQERGAIYCVSGAYLANGIGASILWSLAPAADAGDQFGFSLADVGDVTNDGVHDFLVGQPRHIYTLPSGSGSHGVVRLVNGATHTVVSMIHTPYGGSLGYSLAACGDLNSNGYGDVAIGEPYTGYAEGKVWIVDGFFLTQSAGVDTLSMAQASGYSAPPGNTSQASGFSVASGFDLTGDGKAEVVFGVPGHHAGGAQLAGEIVIYDVVADQAYAAESFTAGEYLGRSIAIGGDYDGDGVADIVAGAPEFKDAAGYRVGRAVVFSSARVIAQTPPYEIYAFHFPSGTPPTNHGDPDPDFHFGFAVEACGDLNGDGVGEILVGAPGYFTLASFPASGWSFRGQVRAYSGATGTLLSTISGGATDRIGDALSGRIGDLDGDGFSEFVLAGSLSDSGGVDSGVLKAYRLFPLPASTYCFGKVNSLGCTPSISFVGSPSETSSASFQINASNVVNQKNGLLFYSHRPIATPFQGGVKCAADPTVRTPTQNSGGATSGANCSGAFSFDFNDWIRNGPDASLATGVEVFAQYWSRDPQSPSHTSLTNAVRFVINP